MKKNLMNQQVWKTLKSSTQIFELEFLKGKLEENNIICVIINKIDSSYNVFGIAELKVMEKDYQKAKKLSNE